MAAPVLQAEGAIGIGQTGGQTPVMPAHQANDILVVQHVIWAPNTASPGVTALSAPTGFTKMFASDLKWPASGDVDGCMNLHWMRATGSAHTAPLSRPASSDTGTDTAHGGRCFVIRGCITTGDPWDDIKASLAQQAANGTVAAVTVSGAERLVVQFLCATCDWATDPSLAGWTAGTVSESTTGTDGGSRTFRKDNVSASTTADTLTIPAADAGGVANTGFYGIFGISFKPPTAAPPATQISLNASLAMTAELADTPKRPFSVAFPMAVGVAKEPSRSPAASLTLTSAISKEPSRALPADLVLTPTISKAGSFAFAPAASLVLTPTASLLVKKGKNIDAGLILASAVVKEPSRALSASLSLTIATQREISRLLSVTLPLTSSMVLLSRKSRVIAASLALTPDMVLRTGGKIFLSADLVLAVDAAREISRSLLASLQMAGALVERATPFRALTASLSLVPALGVDSAPGTVKAAYSLDAGLLLVPSLYVAIPPIVIPPDWIISITSDIPQILAISGIEAVIVEIDLPQPELPQIVSAGNGETEVLQTSIRQPTILGVS
jgi:hypothetical protein